MKKDSLHNFYIHSLFWYFIIFSIFGLFIETIYCYITTGCLESRKGLLFGPFCPVYGVGAAIIILFLDKYKNNGIKLFILGCVLGNFIEYLLSYSLESIYGIRFWDYSYLNLNLNGRICITYSIFWGILSFILIKLVKPQIDKFIAKIPSKIKIYTEFIIFIFLIIDTLVTIWAVTAYQKRATNTYYNTYTNSENSFFSFVENSIFSNDIMKKNFPNLRFITDDGKEIFIRDIL